MHLAPVVSWLLALLLSSLVRIKSLLSNLSMAHLGSMQRMSAFLKWSVSYWKCSGLLHTVLVLWLRVLTTLNLLIGNGGCPTVDIRLYGLPCIYCDRQSTTGFWFDNNIQEGDGTIFFVVLHCKLYCRVNIINVF